MIDLFLKGKTALITGASKRIGRSIALTLAQSGVNIIVHYNNSETDALELCAEIKNLSVDSWLIKADFNNPEETKTLIDRAIALAGPFDILVNSASIFLRARSRISILPGFHRPWRSTHGFRSAGEENSREKSVAGKS